MSCRAAILLLLLPLLLVSLCAAACDVRFKLLRVRLCLRNELRRRHQLRDRSEAACSFLCSKVADCRAFRLVDGGAACETFHFDRCTHEPNDAACTSCEWLYVRAVQGLPVGNFCAGDFGSERRGSRYKIFSVSPSWATAAAACDSEPGLAKFADVDNQEELLHLRDVSRAGGDKQVFLGGSGTAYNKSSFTWRSCGHAVDPALWCSSDPNYHLTGQWLHYTCMDSFADVHGHYAMCECVDPFSGHCG